MPIISRKVLDDGNVIAVASHDPRILRGRADSVDPAQGSPDGGHYDRVWTYDDIDAATTAFCAMGRAR